MCGVHQQPPTIAGRAYPSYCHATRDLCEDRIRWLDEVDGPDGAELIGQRADYVRKDFPFAKIDIDNTAGACRVGNCRRDCA